MTPDELTQCLTPIAKALNRISDLLEMLAIAQDDPEEPPKCQHPEDQRISFGMTKGQPDWQCSLCGERSLPPEQN